MTVPRRIVIVGNGIAGVTAADSLRAVGFDGEITLVGDEAHPAYSRPALSKALLRDEGDLTSHLLPPPLHGATEMLGVRAIGLDPRGRTVALDSGEHLSYDGLIVATGCRPRRIGSGRIEGELTLRTLDDALALRRRVHAGGRIVVIGGGPLGMEVASGALEAGCDVTVVSLDPPMGLQLGDHLSELFVNAALARGLRIVRLGASGLTSSGDVTLVELVDGSVLEADVVVTAIGDIPNVEWLAGSGLLRDGALIADERGQVAPGVVAAGDVATVPTPRGLRRVPLWNSAIEQSKVAAAHLVGVDAASVESHPYFWTDQFGLSLKAVGHAPFLGEPVLVDGDPDEGRLLLQWPGAGIPGGGAAAAINSRIPIPKLRRVAGGGSELRDVV